MIKTCKHCKQNGKVGNGIRRFQAGNRPVYLHDVCADAWIVAEAQRVYRLRTKLNSAGIDRDAVPLGSSPWPR